METSCHQQEVDSRWLYLNYWLETGPTSMNRALKVGGAIVALLGISLLILRVSYLGGPYVDSIGLTILGVLAFLRGYQRKHSDS